MEIAGNKFDIAEIISTNIFDTNGDGIRFGLVVVGSTDSPDLDQTPDAVTPSVTVEILIGTNVECMVTVRGTNFHPTIPITEASWSSDSGVLPATCPMDVAPQQVVGAPVPGGTTVKIWHWLSIPVSAYGGTHTSTFTYSVVGPGGP